MARPNELLEILKIRYPIIQAPMLGVSTVEMVAAASNFGALGSLPVGNLDAQKTASLIHQVKEFTAMPFVVNFFADNPPLSPAEEELTDMQEFLEKLCRENGLPFRRIEFRDLSFPTWKKQVQCLLDANVPIVSFTFGVPDPEAIVSFKEKGIVLIGTATSVAEAKLLHEMGVDVVTAQGCEAGGHRGTFLEGPLQNVNALSLVKEINAVINRPVIAAGGIHDAASMNDALAAGAAGVQIGSAFIASTESAAMPSYKKTLTSGRCPGTILTRAISGRWARGLPNKLISAVEGSGLQIPVYPLQGMLTAGIRSIAQQHDLADFNALWAGQFAHKSQIASVHDILLRLLDDSIPESTING